MRYCGELIMFYETPSWSMIKVICYTDRLSKTKTKSFGSLKIKLSLLFTKTRDLGHTNKEEVSTTPRRHKAARNTNVSLFLDIKLDETPMSHYS